MTSQTVKTAGEVAVNAMDVICEFQRKSVNILRHADRLYGVNSSAELPDCIQSLFCNRSSRYCITDLINVFSTYYIRPIVRHQPSCLCVGADENVFANIIWFSLEGQDNEVKILGSLLIRPQHLTELVKKAKVVAHLINEDLKNNFLEKKPTQTFQSHLN